MNKKVYFFLGGILVLIVVTIGVIVYLSNKNKDLAAQPPANNPSAANDATGGILTPATNNSGTNSSSAATNSSGAASGGSAPNKVSDGAVVSPAFSFDNKAIWYFSPDGHLYKENLSSGLKQEYVLPSLVQADNVIWPITGNDFIVQTNNTDGSKKFTYYDSKTKLYVPYPSNVKEVDFLQDGTHVVYQWVDSSGKSTLSTANGDLSGHATILGLPDADDVIKAAPNNNKIFAYKNKAPADGKIYYVNLDSPKLVAIKTAASNQVLWSPDGQHFVFDKLGSDNDASSTQFWLGDLRSKNDQPLGISTDISKMAFDSTGQNLYYAAAASGGNDAFCKIDMNTLQKTQIFSGSSSSSISATNLIISKDGTALYYKNSDGYLYSIAISGS